MSKKQEHLQPSDPDDVGDAWVWKAIALPSRLRVVTHLSHDRSEKEAITFLARFKAKTDGRPPLFTSDKLPAYIQALIANYSTPEPPPVKRGPGRPRKEPRRGLDPELCYAQVDKHRESGRVVEVRRRIVFGTAEVITEILGPHQINMSYVERDNLTSRQSNGRLVRKTLSHSKKDYYLQRHLDLEDAVFNFARPHLSLRVAFNPHSNGRKWQQRTPAMAAELTDHIWTLEELLSYRVPPSEV
ncbi:MAG: transposase [Acidobacteria bacterium]|nr:transposase [Acidobacteriota bacterium]